MNAADKLAEALRAVRATLERENEAPLGAIYDTIWHGPGETLFDFIDSKLTAYDAEKAKASAPTTFGIDDKAAMQRMTEIGAKAWAGVDPQSLRDGAEPFNAGAFIQHAQTASGAPGRWPDEFLAWYQPDKWLSEERAAAVFLGQKLAVVKESLTAQESSP